MIFLPAVKLSCVHVLRIFKMKRVYTCGIDVISLRMFNPRNSSPASGIVPRPELEFWEICYFPRTSLTAVRISIGLTLRDHTCAPVVASFFASSLRLVFLWRALRLLNWLSMGPFQFKKVSKLSNVIIIILLVKKIKKFLIKMIFLNKI